MIEEFINDNALEEYLEVCVWKATMNNNKRGIGTTFDPENLTEAAKKCYDCNDFYPGSKCKAYTPK